MLPHDELYRQMTLILREVFDDDHIVACPEMSADTVDGWSSLAQIRLITTVERTFRVKFSTAEVVSFHNVGEIIEAIATRKA